jgi:hypothetical protein
VGPTRCVRVPLALAVGGAGVHCSCHWTLAAGTPAAGAPAWGVRVGMRLQTQSCVRVDDPFLVTMPGHATLHWHWQVFERLIGFGSTAAVTSALMSGVSAGVLATPQCFTRLVALAELEADPVSTRVAASWLTTPPPRVAWRVPGPAPGPQAVPLCAVVPGALLAMASTSPSGQPSVPGSSERRAAEEAGKPPAPPVVYSWAGVTFTLGESLLPSSRQLSINLLGAR